ncbi:GNAT family N-acetyltransferase [Kribbella deserti]|uniref:GNAT family N-acetyltransferase n=1 Tax=Kribbella deserti TaxID=1926257 RepID=A0ABV6QTK1_9ACTN
MTELRTDRLLLRQWTAADREPFAAMNNDPAVMRYFPKRMTREESDALADRCAERIVASGYGLWAVEVVETGQFIGFTGLAPIGFEVHFAPAVEIGWRLAEFAWGKGYATEAARAALAHAFGPAGLTEIVSMTAVQNEPSRRVMERLGMTHDPADDFDHPRIEKGHPLERHVLYRLDRTTWEQSCRTP